MKLQKFLLIMMALTAVSLVYTHLQVQILDLAYQGKVKEREVQRLLDDHGRMLYTISSLKSANHLGLKVLTEKSDLQFRDKYQIVQLPQPREDAQNDTLALSPSLEKKSNFFAGLFSLKSQAEAGFTK